MVIVLLSLSVLAALGRAAVDLAPHLGIPAKLNAVPAEAERHSGMIPNTIGA